MPDFAKMQETLMRELRLMHYPIAIKYFFDEAELAAFRKDHPHYSPVKPLTFCQAEIGARMRCRACGRSTPWRAPTTGTPACGSACPLIIHPTASATPHSHRPMLPTPPRWRWWP